MESFNSLTQMDSKGAVSNDNKSNYLFANSKDNVKVVIRVRPLNDREKGNGGYKKCVIVENQSSIAIDGYKAFNFDYVADEDIQQSVIFQQIAQPIADCCLEGYNGTIFAYGQTGSGKTFTIQGPTTSIENGEETIYGSRQKGGDLSENARGIMQRSFEYIFNSLDQDRTQAENCGDSYQFEYLIRCSYLEIYNEQILDLLEPSSVNLHIREDIKKGVYVEGLQEEVVQSAEDMIQIIQLGAKNRHIGSHSLNKESSRSHSVLTTIIESKSMKEGGVWNIKTSRFHIIDLAGSERSKQTNAVGERLKEAGMINKSLSALGNVINSLVDISEGKSRHVHYRDSKLTFLLRDSLGGNSKTLIIANVSPSNQCHGETLSTLKFAQRAKLIKNKAVINEDSSGTIQLLKAEISRLKKDLAENEKIIRSVSNSQDCPRCKAMFEDLDEDPSLSQDEMLLSFDDGQQKKQHRTELHSLRSRVTHLESLLSANLDSMSSQQRYYEGEVTKLVAQQRRMQQTVESYEKQSARDKMIIKFREERISKLEREGLSQAVNEGLIEELRKEVSMWKEAAEHNTQAAKLFAEKNDLQKKLESIDQEVRQSPESLTVQIKSLTEFNESLSLYLKSYCEESKKELEKELAQAKIDLAEYTEDATFKLREVEISYQSRLTQQESSFKETLDSYQTEVARLESLLTQERIDLADSLQRLRLDADQSEQLIRDQLTQCVEEERVKCERLLKEKDFFHQLRFNEAESDLERMKQSIRQLQSHQEQERKRHEQVIAVIEDRWSNKVQEMDLVISQHINSNELLTQSNEQLNEDIQTVRDEVLEMQGILATKETKINEYEQIIQSQESALKQLQDQNSHFEQQISTLRSKIKFAEIQTQQTLAELKSSFDQQLADFSNQLLSKNDQLLELKRDYQSLEQESIDLRLHNQSLTIAHQEKLAQLSVEKRNEIETLTKDSAAALDQVRSQQHQALEQTRRDLESKMEAAVKAKQSEIDRLQGVLQGMQETISQLQNNLEENESNFDQEIILRQKENENALAQINKTINEKDASINNLQLTIKTLKDQISSHLESSQSLNAYLEQLQMDLHTKTMIIQDKDSQLKSLQETYEQQLSDLNANINQEKLKFTQALQNNQSEIISQLQSSYQQVQEQLENANSQLTRKASMIVKLKSEVENCQSIIASKETEIGQIRSDQNRIINQIESQLEHLTQERISIEEESNLQIQEERDQYKRYIETFTLQYEKQIQEKEGIITRIRQEQSHSHSKDRVINESLQNENSQLKSFVEQQKHQINELQTQVQSKTQEVNHHTQHLNSVNTALGESQAKLSNYHLETTRLALQLDQQLSLRDKLQKELEAKNADIQVLINKKDDLKVKVKELENQLENALHDNLKIAEQNEGNKRGLEQISLENRQLKQEISNLQTQQKQSAQENADNRLQALQTKLTTQISNLTQDLSAKDAQLTDMQNQISKYKRRLTESEDQLRQSKDSIAQRIQKETELQAELKAFYQEHTQREEKLRRQIGELREEKDRSKKEIDSLKELVRVKDKQIDDYLQQDQREKAALDRMAKEIKDFRDKLAKREFEMKELVKTLKFYTEEKSKLEKEVEKLSNENKQLIGHKNPNQKIQHHLKIKEENNRLREDNIRLQEDLKRMIEIIGRGCSCQQKSQMGEDNKFEIAANRLIDHLLTQPSVIKTLGISDEQYEQVMQLETTTLKVKKAMEIVSALNESIQMKETRIRELEKDAKKLESQAHILVQDRNIVQQRDIIMSPMLDNPVQLLNKNNPNLNIINNNRIPSAAIYNKENVQAGVKPPSRGDSQSSNPNGINTVGTNRMTIQHQQLLQMTSGLVKSTPNEKLIGRPASSKRLVQGAASAFLSSNASHSTLELKQTPNSGWQQTK